MPPTRDPHEHLEWLPQLQLDWIKTAETKAAAAACFALLGASATILGGNHQDLIPHTLVVPAAPILASLFICLWVVVPRTSGGTGLLYFGHVEQQDLTDYRKALAANGDLLPRSEIIASIHACAGIARRKHEAVRLAIILLAAGLAWGTLIELLRLTA